MDRPAAAQSWAAEFVRKDNLEQQNDPCFGYFETFTEAQDSWSGVTYQCLVGSTWNGLGCLLFNAFYISIAAIVTVVSLVFTLLVSALCFCCVDGRKTAKYLGNMTLMAGMLIPINLKNMLYHTIRAVPIVGYPLSQGINKAAESFYAISCVENQIRSFLGFMNPVKPRGNNNG